MITTIIIFLPLILTTIWAIYKSIGRHILPTTICLPIITTLFLFHMLYLTDYWYLGHHEWNTISKIDCWLYPFIIPTLYAHICFKTGRQSAILNVINMLAFALLNFTSGIVINIKGGPTAVSEDFFNLTITWGDRILTTCPIQEFVLVVQAAWFLSRIYAYKYVMKREKTHLSNESIKLAKAILLTLITGTLGFFMPNSFYDRTWTFFLLTDATLSATLTYCIYLIGKGYLITPIIDENNEQALSTITESKANIFKRIDSYVKSSKCFLNSGLLISDVAKAVETNRLYVSGAIQKETGDNFNNYINGFRVKAAKSLIINRPDIKLDDVAIQCGFGSASSFTKIFKKHTGQTPSELRVKARTTPKEDLHTL